MPLVLLLAGGALTRLAAAIPAFPGATGAGAVSVGGRGGDVYEVTNLADSGAGSLRYGIDNQKYSTAPNHARTIVFRVGGTIELKSPIGITTPYLTIADQTAPGGGIQLSGRTQTGRMVNIATHDVTLRYLRIRKGYLGHEIDETGAVLFAWNKSYNCIFDHLTLMWALDETACAWGAAPATTAPHDITWSWSILAEPLSVHPTALLTGSGDWNTSQHMTNTDMHHCLDSMAGDESESGVCSPV